ncbi:TetR/AcrR family transcriptional regulator [uncultured Aquimarina sp.]|uniref:TetR/AcrR family transcriptional regulator n=1 Tax=uncultured Aquimarina sp. TaxID=575652 RepID=UPI0026240D58|nr:TetR/AcrR family transcriptional regulator [uncultured Aquimarina sp.]
MRPQKILDEELIIGLTKTFRAKGYEGTSLNEIAEVTGLKKASLYHRFPKGKKEMAERVFDHVGNWVEDHIFFALTDENTKPRQRLVNALAHIRTLYNEGNETCVFRAFSMQAGLELFEKQVNNGMKSWINAFTEIGLALNLPSAKAKEKAVQTLIEIQGSLIVTKGLHDTTIFESTIKTIEKRYLE